MVSKVRLFKKPFPQTSYRSPSGPEVVCSQSLPSRDREGAAQGVSNLEIAAQLGTRAARVSKWRTRFAGQRLAGLADEARPGKPRRYDADTEKRILQKLDNTPPFGHATWTAPRLAAALGDVSDQQVWRVLRRRAISLCRRRSWRLSSDPEFSRKAAHIVGL